MRVLIILAGGFGTRLRTIVDDVPKPMAPVSGKPFLSWLVDAWLSLDFNFDQIIFLVGYKAEAIRNYFGSEYKGTGVVYSTDRTPLGTGGALINACRFVDSEMCVVNGDTWFLPSSKSDWPLVRSGLEICLLLKYADDVSRYGSMTLDSDRSITSIKTNGTGRGYLNGGVYFINRNAANLIGNYLLESPPLSLEDDIFPCWIKNENLRFWGKLIDQPFLDIGIPGDYLKAESFINTNFERGK